MSNHLPLGTPEASNALKSASATYATDVLHYADTFARKRRGSVIDVGEISQAVEYLERKGKSAQILLLISGTLLGSGVGGLAQNAVDHKTDWVVYAVFGLLLLAGVGCAYRAFRP